MTDDPLPSWVDGPAKKTREARVHPAGLGVTPCIVSGGGTEFVRAVSQPLYGIPVLRRTARVLGDPNEGDTKVVNIRLHLGTRPVLAAGNSAGDARMLDHVRGDDHDGVALLVDHDDADREYACASVAGTFDAEPVLTTAARRQWTVASMRADWRTVFDPA